MDELVGDLKALLDAGQAVLVVGSGVSVASSAPVEGRGPVASWAGLLRAGLAHAGALGALNEGQVRRYLGLLEEGDTEDFVTVAHRVEKALGAPRGGEFKRWLRETIGALQVRDPQLIEAIAALGAPIVTLNYDGLLEEVTGLGPLTWREGSEIERWLRGQEPGVLHLHGFWRQPGSVVLGVRSYEDILRDGHAQAVMRALWTTKSLVFVGCGGTTEDPNLGALLTWAGRTFTGSEYRRYRLCRASEVAEVRRAHPPEQRVVPLVYGDAYGDLTGFLRRLAGVREVDGGGASAEAAVETPMASGSSAGQGTATPAPSGSPAVGGLTDQAILTELFCSLFADRRDLRQTFIRWKGFEAVVLAIPGPDASIDVVAAKVAEVLERKGFVDAAFFDLLVAAFRRREKDIRQAQREILGPR
ncbi:MAG: SIR2 family protein [Alphaproteobacteria bacterium]|nr:SIR2 family protein [Alphaproteobacteria bacterium]